MSWTVPIRDAAEVTAKLEREPGAPASTIGAGRDDVAPLPLLSRLPAGFRLSPPRAAATGAGGAREEDGDAPRPEEKV